MGAAKRDDVPAYVTNPRGHVWQLDSRGDVDIFGVEANNHNGPLCTVCGYGFCHHCQSEADHDCPGPETPEQELAGVDAAIKRLTLKRNTLRRKFAKR